jgi:phosphomecalonate degydratase large subunit
LELTKEEENMLNGEHGESFAVAYRILLAIGEATEASKLVPVKWAHISGVNYNTIGDSGVKFLEEFSRTGRVAIRTTINPMGYDKGKTEDLSDRFLKKQSSIVNSYRMLGAIPSFTCVPYEIFDIPEKGSMVSFAESSAAIFSNSILGLLTNRESSLSALASSLTGKTPYSDLLIENFRQAKVAVRPDFTPSTELDYGMLGYFAGNTVKDTCVEFIPPEGRPDRIQAKALSAAIGTSGSCGMFTFGHDSRHENRREIISFGKEDAARVKDELSTRDDGDLIALGGPQLGLNELSLLSRLIEGKKLKKRCMIFCARATHCQAKELGLVDKIEKAGGEFMCDSCTCMTPLITRADFDSVVTNSIKAAYYLDRSNGIGVALKDLKTIVKDCSERN